MKKSGYPKARVEGLVLRELPEEVLVYDTDSHEAHCLNDTAAFVWKQCDGTTDVPEIVERARATFETDMDDDVVWAALEDLWKRGLLEGEPAPAREGTMSRGQALKRAGIVAAVSVPVITSIVAPKAAHAATCIPSGQPCTPGQSICCPDTTCPGGGVCP
jgi:Coenzyme PQQ synthesis protein D (PqqD)